MSHSGNNSSRRLRHLPPPSPAKAIREGEQLYNPSVFRYKCIGYLNLNSEQKGSPGVCRGLQSKMERVANMVPDTREASIKKFLDAASDLGTYVDQDDTADQKVKEIYTSRTMIYKDDQDQDAVVAERNQKAKIQPVKSSPFPEEDLIDKTEWSCYGSTLVHYLVLDPIVQNVKVEKHTTRRGRNRPNPAMPPEFAEMEKRADQMFDDFMKRLGNFDSPFHPADERSDTISNDAKDNTKNKHFAKEKDTDDDEADKNDVQHVSTTVVTKVVTSSSSKGGKITAITPENIGVSVRKIDSEVGHFTVTDIGSIRICMETSSSLMGDDTNAPDNNSNTETNKQLRRNLSKAEDSSMRSQGFDGAVDRTIDQEKQEEKKRTVDLKKFYDFTFKVAQKMDQNVNDVKDALSEDFPGRTYRFGTKVVKRLEKTTEQTFAYMGKLFDSFWKS